MDALLSGKYDLHKVAVIMTQTGGGCRATNYIGFIRRALEKAGMAQIPVISINMSGIETNPGFQTACRPSDPCGHSAAIFGDIFMRCVYRMRPYETRARLRQCASSEMDKKVPEFRCPEKASELLSTFRKMCREISR